MAGRRAERPAYFALFEREGCRGDASGKPEPVDRLVAREVVRGLDAQALFARNAREILRCGDLAGELLGQKVGPALRALPLELVGNLVAYLVERTRLGLTRVDHVDDVEAVLGLHQLVGDRAGLQREGGRLELGHHLSPAEVVEIAAEARRTGILGVLLGQRREVGTRLGVGEHGLGLEAHLHFVLAFGLEQDVACAHLLRGRVLRLVVVVVLRDVGVGDDDARPQRFGVNRQVVDLALLGNLIVVGVGLEVRGEVRLTDRDGVPEVVRREDDDVELHLLVAQAVLLV